MPQSGLFLYRNGANELCLFDQKTKKRTVCWKTDQEYMMEHVACSPDGRYVAFLHSIESKPYQLVLFDVHSERSIETNITTDPEASHPEIAWSETPSVLILQHDKSKKGISVQSNGTATRLSDKEIPAPLADVYGRIGRGQWFGGNDRGVSFTDDESSTMRVESMQGLGSCIKITTRNESFVMADNPGWLKLGDRFFGDICILGNGKEVIFDDHHGIYLMDVEKRRVGKIADGSRFIILSGRYCRSTTWNDPTTP
jgi:hypothetical protein